MRQRATGGRRTAAGGTRGAEVHASNPSAPEAADLTVQHEQFILEYVANGGNATAAYAAVHPNCQRRSCATEGYRLLRKPEIAAALHRAQDARWRELKMNGAEALALISMRARVDVGMMFDDKGDRLPVSKWPLALRLCVKSVKPGPRGDTVTFYDGLRAAELLARAAGLLAAEGAPAFDHLAYLAGLERRHREREGARAETGR